LARQLDNNSRTWYKGRMPATRDLSATTCKVEMEQEKKREEEEVMSGWGSPSSTTVENEESVSDQAQREQEERHGAHFNYAHFQDTDSHISTLQRSSSIPNTKSLKDLKKLERRRIISKNGDCNTELYGVSEKHKRLMKDVYTTMVDMQWRYVFLAFIASFIVSWFLFGVIWWLIAYVHGDYLLENINNSTFVPCILANKNFASAFLFSQETQHTIGYGSRQTTEECTISIFIQCAQSIVGVLIQACMAGVVFAKLARAKSRASTVVFSKTAVITMRNKELFLLFRVGNIRASHLLEAHVRAQMVHKVTTEEGEVIHLYQEELKVGTQLSGEDDRALLLWPITVAHKIDEDSPLWCMTPQETQNSAYEVIVTLEGIVEPTGNTTQARTSYLPTEILWGHRFVNLVTYAQKQGVYGIDCSSIDCTVPDNTPRISASRLQYWNANKKGSYDSTEGSRLYYRKQGDHLSPPANMTWEQGHLGGQHQEHHQGLGRIQEHEEFKAD